MCASNNERINIILIVSDTFRNDLISGGFAVKGDVKARLPNLTRISESSVKFTRHYTASFPTVPNRHDLFTGRYTFIYADWAPLPQNEITLPQMLKKVGYTSALIADTPHILKDGYNFDRGFDAWEWIRGQENDRYRTDPQELDLPCKPEKLRNAETTKQHMRNNFLRQFEEDWIPAKTAKAATNWLEKNYGGPFFLYADFFDPHEPWDPPREFVDKYDPGYVGEEVIYPAYGPSDYLTEGELTHCRAMYAAEATLVDKWIGRIVEKVEDLGLWENTALIFTSDHGFYLGEHGLIGKSIIMGDVQGSAPLYEEVAHIPLLLRLPEKIRPKTLTVSELTQPQDVTATVLDLAGSDQKTEGSSLMSLIDGRAESWRNFVISTPSLVHGAAGGVRPTVTSKEWSLILSSTEVYLKKEEYTMMVDGNPRLLKPFGKVDTELYDLRSDPFQQINVIDKEQEVARRLKEEFISKLKSLGAKDEVVRPWLKCKRLERPD
ncbi:MAG: sulfatase [Thermoprotei archaeon]